MGIIEKTSGKEPKVETPIDLGSLGDPSALPQREIARLVSSRESRFQVVIARSVLEDIHDHGRSQPEVEVCGVLVGNVYRDQSGPYLHIEANIRGNNAAGKAAQVTFTAETWSHIQEVMEEEHEGDRIVGWYHTHPGFGIFLSDMDLFIQNNFFGESWQVAFVYDSKSNEEGLFLRKDGQTVREKFLVDEETDDPAAASRTELAGATQMVAPGTLAELSDRVQKLERKGRWHGAGIGMLMLIALLWPLAVFILGPMGIAKLPPELRRLLQRDGGEQSPRSLEQQRPPTTAPAVGPANPVPPPPAPGGNG